MYATPVCYGTPERVAWICFRRVIVIHLYATGVRVLVYYYSVVHVTTPQASDLK